MRSPGAKKVSGLPPNPDQWQPERNGLAFRSRFGVAHGVPLRPFDIVKLIPDVHVLGQEELSALLLPATLAAVFGPLRDRWSAATVPMNGDGFVIIMNDTHAQTRQNATLMEELFHIHLRHRPLRIMPCPITGLMKREYDERVEKAAYHSAAAALVPYSAVRPMVLDGAVIASIATHFEVSADLVSFRLKVTKLWSKAKR